MPKSFNLKGGKPNRIGEFTRRTGALYLDQNLIHSTMKDLEWKNEGILGPLSPGEIESNSLWRGLTGKGRSRAGLNWRLPKLPSRRANPIGRAIKAVGARTAEGITQGAGVVGRAGKLTAIAGSEVTRETLRFVGKELIPGLRRGGLPEIALVTANLIEPALIGMGVMHFHPMSSIAIGYATKAGYVAAKKRKEIGQAIRFVKANPEVKTIAKELAKRFVLPDIKNFVLHGERNIVDAFSKPWGGRQGRRAVADYLTNRNLTMWTGKLHIPGEVVRPRSNVIHGIIEGMSHSGIAKFMRRALTTFGSAHRGIMFLEDVVMGLYRNMGLVGKEAKAFAFTKAAPGKTISETMRDVFERHIVSNVSPLEEPHVRKILSAHIAEIKASEAAGFNYPVMVPRGLKKEVSEAFGVQHHSRRQWSELPEYEKTRQRGLRRMAAVQYRGILVHERAHQVNAMTGRAYKQTEKLSNFASMEILKMGYTQPEVLEEAAAYGHQFNYTKRKGFTNLAPMSEEVMAYANKVGASSDIRPFIRKRPRRVFEMGPIPRPETNIHPHGEIAGLPEGGLGAAMRHKLTNLGSAAKGIMKLLPGQVLEKVSQAFSKLTGGRIKNILEMGEESFLKMVKSGEAGIAFKERESLWTDWSLVTMRNAQKERNALLPGLQTWEEAATDTLPERKFFAYNTAIGTKAGEDLRTVGAASMYRSPTGEWIRGGLTVAEEFRGKGPRGLGATLSRALFEQGAVIPDTLSTSGAKAYYRQVSAMRDEVLAMENLTRAQSEFTVPGVPASLNKERGIRRGPNGGNG